ncbi:hypothetical protein WA026_010846 [Henosepilachna vigintioctopunctata]|uniref:Cytochrome P450 n=1 Tax=Henosepilachna vigintioctopunctata TaxID=420089 RepID=A0AAW1UQ87_9CUCU
MKQICVKDFDHFLNHKGLLPDGVEEFWSKNLVGLKATQFCDTFNKTSLNLKSFHLTGQSWKNMRSVLSPSFTSSKMKSMFTLMCHNAELFSQHFMKKTGNVTEVEFKDAFTRYTNDVIASTAFGLQGHLISHCKKKIGLFCLSTISNNHHRQEWKNMLSTLSPSFTSSKMRYMFELMNNNSKMFVQHFLQKNERKVEVAFKDAFTRFTNDVIASTDFGVHVDSLKDRNNEFYLMGKEASDFTSFTRKVKFFFYLLIPKIASFLRIDFFGKEVTSFFMNLVTETIKIREERKINRMDMLGLLIEARKGQQKDKTPVETTEASFAVVEEHLEMNVKQDLTDADIASQVFIFFFGGFDIVSRALSFMAHELAANVDVQERLIEEIDANRPAEGSPSYETIANMTYMDMVVAETLRKWPLNIAVDRVVTKPYTIEPELPGEEPVHLEKDDNIMISIWSIHHDPQYYENPEKFDPERFSSENRKNIQPYTYIPFGVGPRNCIGSRFAILEMKALFFHLLSHFKIEPVAKTQIPLQINKKSIGLSSVDDFTLGLERRDQYWPKMERTILSNCM